MEVEEALPCGQIGALTRLASSMPPDLRRAVDDLLLLYALNGLSMKQPFTPQQVALIKACEAKTKSRKLGLVFMLKPSPEKCSVEPYGLGVVTQRLLKLAPGKRTPMCAF